MSKFLAGVKQFIDDESGPTAVEYAVMLALIVVVCITAITTLGNNANSTFSNVALNAAVSAAAAEADPQPAGRSHPRNGRCGPG